MEKQVSYWRTKKSEADWKTFCNLVGNYYNYIKLLNSLNEQNSQDGLTRESLKTFLTNIQTQIEKIIPNPNAIEEFSTSDPSMCMTEFHEQSLLVKALREKNLLPALYLLEHGAKKIKHRANRKKILGNDANGYLREQYRNLRKLMKESKEASS